MKLLLWVGNEPNQRALANKLAEEFTIVGIISESRIGKRKITVAKLASALIERTFLPAVRAAWWEMVRYYDNIYPAFPDVQHLNVDNINGADAYDFSRRLQPDLIIVSGTSLIKKKMLSVPSRYGMLNLHTGVSPYIKGGPNCTNWCIATNQFHLVGSTVMWIDEGIDSGNILASELCEVDWTNSLSEIQIAVMNHAHDLYVRSIKFISRGGTSSIPQKNLGTGKTYFTKEWKLKNKIDLLRNLKRVRSQKYRDEISEKQKVVDTVKLKNP